MILLGGGASGRWLGHEGEFLMNGIGALRLVRTQLEASPLWTRTWLLTRPWLPAPWSHVSRLQNYGKSISVVISHSVYSTSLQQPEQPKTHPGTTLAEFYSVILDTLISSLAHMQMVFQCCPVFLVASLLVLVHVMCPAHSIIWVTLGYLRLNANMSMRLPCLNVFSYCLLLS